MPRMKRRATESIMPVVTDGHTTRKKRACTEALDCDMFNGQDVCSNSFTNSIRMSNYGVSHPHSHDEQLLPLLNAYSQPNCSANDQLYAVNKHTMLKVFGHESTPSCWDMRRSQLGRNSTMLNVSGNCASSNSHNAHIHSQHAQSRTMPSHPNVSFSAHPFYDNLNDGQILRVTTLMAQQPPHFVKGENSANFSFNLTSRQVSLFPQSQMRGPYQPQENELSVLLRFCKYDMTSEQEDSLPVHLSISCNNMSVPLQCPLPTNKTGMDGRRIGRPVDITHQVYFVPGTTNNLSIHWHYDPDNKFQSSVYCLTICLVKRLTPNDLMRKLQRRQKSDELSKQMIRQQLCANDADISMRSLGASLLCPLGKTRIGLPVRGHHCRHVQCFDAYCYLAMNERRPTWRCPTCDEPAPFRELYIDSYFRTILEKARAEDIRVEFAPDGTWVAKGEEDEEEEHQATSCAPSINPPTSSRPPLTSSSCSSSAPPPSGSTAVDATVIDLTGSDDDEPAPSHPPPAAPCIPQQPPILASSSTESSISSRLRPKTIMASANLPPPPDTVSRRKNLMPTRHSSMSKRPRLRPTTPTEVIDLESSDESEVDTGPAYAFHQSNHVLTQPPISQVVSSGCSSSSSSVSSAPHQPPTGLPNLPPGHHLMHEHTKTALGALLHPYSSLTGLDHGLTSSLLPPPPPMPHHASTGAPHPLLSTPRHYPPPTQPGPCLPPYGPSPCSPSAAAVVAAAAAAAAAGVPPPSPLGHPSAHLNPYNQAHLSAMSSFSFLRYSATSSNPSFNGASGDSNSPCTMSPDGGYFV